MDKDVKKILTLLAKQKEANPKETGGMSSTLVDTVFKFVSAITFALVSWNFSTTNDLKEDVSIIKVENSYTKDAVKVINSFVEKPRFTKEEFTESIKPLIKQINKNTDELNSRNNFMNSTNDALLRLKIKVVELEKQVENYKK